MPAKRTWGGRRGKAAEGRRPLRGGGRWAGAACASQGAGERGAEGSEARRQPAGESGVRDAPRVAARGPAGRAVIAGRGGPGVCGPGTGVPVPWAVRSRCLTGF